MKDSMNAAGSQIKIAFAGGIFNGQTWWLSCLSLRAQSVLFTWYA
jgi:hypothetical protein